MSIETKTFILDHSKTIAPEVKHFALRYQGNEAFDFIPGQFISVHFDKDGSELKRSYSIATIPTKTDLIEFAASFVEGGPGSEYLFNLQPGDELKISGPAGRLLLMPEAEQPKRLILVATGTGVTPYRAMLPELKKRIEQTDLKVVQLLGVRSQEHVLYAQDFIDCAKQHENYDYLVYYSREYPQTPESYERKGYVQTAFDNDIAVDPEQDMIYLCGNPDMIDQAFALLKEKGFTPKNVRREKYISPITRK